VRLSGCRQFPDFSLFAPRHPLELLRHRKREGREGKLAIKTPSWSERVNSRQFVSVKEKAQLLLPALSS